ncbi:chemotaxis protein CheD [Methanolobus mangrovi]|uniref:Probable chemoreceptor glutamine deamidase CheD n=1 Tax=Methanolobus mangrovi TaxID=3072977 RepID=A0AA51YGR2_9EURY|nr:chemotaxis protein CheD [Methanolobus mangrovi]WMW22351.1 chemotaxis protein CheD [Methanolobus mangrovi]
MIIVGMADSAVAKKPTKLTTLGLGSCVGISLYDKSTYIGGMVHIMLPSIDQARSKENMAKFADTGIPSLLDSMVDEGAYKHRITAKIAGGASMFSFNSSTQLNIGERNIAATKQVLKELKIPIIAQDTGLNYGRTIILDTENGELTVKSAIKGIKTY